MEFDVVQQTRQADQAERLQHELWAARAECDRLVSARHSPQGDLVRQGDELEAALRDLAGTRAELAAAHAELAAVRGGAVGAGACGGVVCVNTADPAGLDDGALLERLIGVGEARNRIDGSFCEAAGELVRRDGKAAAAWAMREYLRVSGFEGRRDAALAEDLVEHELGDTVAALRRGEITQSHARVIASAASKPHTRPEDELLDIARAYPVDTCGRCTRAYESQETLAEAQAEEAAADAELQAQREQRRASLRPGEDGLWELTARFDYLTGRRVNQQLRAMIASLRQEPGDASRSYPQRAADALAELITGDGNHLPPRTNLLVIADYDAVAGRICNPRLDDGTPLSAELLAELAANAKVLPAVFDAKWANLALGAARNAGDAQKLVLAARDGGCISCGAHSEETHAHHIRFHSDGGPTDIPNLASLCPRCHNLIHDHNWQVHVSADGHPKIRPPPTSASPPTPPPSANSNGPPASAQQTTPADRRTPQRTPTPSSEPEPIGLRCGRIRCPGSRPSPQRRRWSDGMHAAGRLSGAKHFRLDRHR